MGHDRVWDIGPLLQSDSNVVGPYYSQHGGLSVMPHEEVMTWLDDKFDDSIVYVCFRIFLKLTQQKIDALATALESSEINFIWHLRIQEGGETGNEDVVIKEYKNRVASRGLINKGWAAQVALLIHQVVGILLTHYR